MFLKMLQIENLNGIIRKIPFHKGLNLIVDETIGSDPEATGNNVGKTTVLRLIDFCMGGKPQQIYTDPENNKKEYTVVKEFLQKTEVLVTLILTEDLDDQFAKQVVIERNFATRKGIVRKIDGKSLTEAEFLISLTNLIFREHGEKKPSLAQLLAHNIRYKDISLSNTLKNVNQWTKDEEYEALYLFMLGCDFSQGDERQKILTAIRVENIFKSRLETSRTRSAYEASLGVLMGQIDALNARRSTFQVNPDFQDDLTELDRVTYLISVETAEIGRATLRKNLIDEAVQDLSTSRVEIDIEQLTNLYREVTTRLGGVQKSFDELVDFHNRMIDEKTRYIAKEIPQLEIDIAMRRRKLTDLLQLEKQYSDKIAKNGTLAQLELLIGELSEKERQRGEYETVILQIRGVEIEITRQTALLTKIDTDLFSDDTRAAVQVQVDKFNKVFSRVSNELYNESYFLSFDVTKKNGQNIYKFNTFNLNLSSGKKQGEISCFDIAYTLFADEENIPCVHFLLNDKKELMHDNQLTQIARLVERENDHVQFVASILRDKLPAELNNEEFFIVKLSQQDMLFRIKDGAN
ncbi:DUF2326 domain-containing protein [Janthinobacterium sp. HLX7-2]|uniref:DUF2326 domain-containing protein n=1 Tax=Janthinobacterium sp. HLX7-2 TaxID=1259331 RepID=UPI003F250C82